MLFILSCLLLFMVSGITISSLMDEKKENTVQAADKYALNAKEKKNIDEKEVNGVIVIDPGHGGRDPGSDADGVYEKEVTLLVANYMGAYLKKNNYQVIYTRDKDVSLGDHEVADLQNRIDIAEANQADLFVSLHLNSSELIYQRAHGFDLYANEGVGQSMTFANNIMQEMTNLNFSRARHVQNGDILHVIKKNKRPAVLVEMGFVTDAEDLAYLRSAKGQKAIGEAIAKAIIQTK